MWRKCQFLTPPHAEAPTLVNMACQSEGRGAGRLSQPFLPLLWLWSLTELTSEKTYFGSQSLRVSNNQGTEGMEEQLSSWHQNCVVGTAQVRAGTRSKYNLQRSSSMACLYQECSTGPQQIALPAREETIKAEDSDSHSDSLIPAMKHFRLKVTRALLLLLWSEPHSRIPSGKEASKCSLEERTWYLGMEHLCWFE